VGEIGELPARTQQRVRTSEGLATFLEANDISLACTSYQTGRLYFVGRGRRGDIEISHALFPQATGFAVDGNSIVLATMTQIIRLQNIVTGEETEPRGHDKMFVPRTSHLTGNVEVHQVGVGADEQIIFVNTTYNCLCTLSRVHSFKPVWKPSFVSALVAEDRCHLNGVAMEAGRPKYVTAFARSDTRHGWRAMAGNTGIVIDVDSQTIVAEGLSMPHSPRLYRGKLWLTNSGTGEFGHIDPGSGIFVPLCFAPGYLRGIDFFGDFALLSLSTFRPGRSGHLQLEDRLRRENLTAWCGLQIVSLETGAAAHWLRFEGVINELFDVAVLPETRNPTAIGFQYKDIQDLISLENPGHAL